MDKFPCALSDSGKMKRGGISVSLEVEFNDDYDELVKKAAEILQLSHVKNLHLFRLRGALLPRKDDWCIGKYMQSLHYASETIELGLGYLNQLQVWQKESQHFSDEVMPKTFQPEDCAYAPHYMCW